MPWRRSFGLALALALLPAPAFASEPSSEAVLAELPFLESDEPNRIIVDLAPEGRKRRMRMILDTGATFSVVTPRVARAMGVHVRRLKSDPYRRSTVVGDDLDFYVDTRSSDTASRTGWEYGLLGGNFLANYVLELDFERRRVRFLDPDRFEVPEEVESEFEAVIPIEIVANRIIVDLALEGAPVPCLLDTGKPTTVGISDETAKKLGIDHETLPGMTLGSVLGEVASEYGEAQYFELGPLALERVPVVVLPHGFFNLGVPGDGIFGYDILSQFLVRIDYPRARLWLRRRPDAQVTWLGEPWSGRYEETDVATLVSPLESAPSAEPDLTPARDAEPAQHSVWVEVEAPAPETEVAGRLDWIEVRGWAGSGSEVLHDVVVLVDVSGSTGVASGVDVDGDGKLGKARRRRDDWRTFNPAHLSSDPGDTVLAAELVATRRLIEVLDPGRTRVGLLTFSSGSTLEAPVGTGSDDMEKAMRDLEGRFASGATNLAEATLRGTAALRAAGGEGRRQSLLILSDGYPTAPGSEKLAAERAYGAARAAAEMGVRVYTFGLGLGELRENDVFVQMARVSGGRHIRLDRPGEVVHELPRIDLAGVAEVAIENATTGEAARAARVFPDGSFDGFVRLAPGDNMIRIVARSDSGATRRIERTVYFDSRDPRDADEEEAFYSRRQRMHQLLEARIVETGLAAEIQRQREAAAQRRELEVRVEPSDIESTN